MVLLHRKKSVVLKCERMQLLRMYDTLQWPKDVAIRLRRSRAKGVEVLVALELYLSPERACQVVTWTSL